MRKSLTIAGMSVTAITLIVLSASVGTSAPPPPAPPKPGHTLLQCPGKFTEHQINDFAHDGWTDNRSPEQIAEGVWAATNPLRVAGAAAGRVYDTPAFVQLAYHRNGRVDVVHTFSRSKGGWQNDRIDQCSDYTGAGVQ